MPESQTLAAQGAGAYPLIILLLALGWPALLALAAARAHRFLREGLPGRGSALVPLTVTVLVALAMALAFSPRLPVLSTYTGLAHIVSAYRIADLEWHWAFPSDYPLAVPVLVAGLVKVIGRTPDAWAAVSLFLTLLGCAGIVLLAAEWFRCGAVALVAGLVSATLPPVLLLARADSLSIGYFALAPWVVLFAIDRLATRSRLSLAGLAVSLFLAVQTRPEAMAFLLVPLALPLFVPCRHREAQALPTRSVATVLADVACLAVPIGLALLALGPYLSVLFPRMSEASGGELGFHRVPHLLGGTAALSALLVVPAQVPFIGDWFDSRSLRAGLLLTVALCAAGLAVFGPPFLIPMSTIPWFEGGETFRTVPFWHFNPKLVPLTAIIGASIGLVGGKGREDRLSRILLVLWLGGVVTAASAKATGELPFEGLRTQVPATVPFALLAGAGIGPLLRPLSARLRPLVCGAGLLPFLPLCLLPVARLDYDQQQEYRFLAECLERLPERTTLYLPADIVPVLLPGDTVPVPVDLFTLHRSGYLLDSFGDAAQGSRVAPLGPAAWAQIRKSDGASPVPLDGSSGTPGEEAPWYVFLGLNCYRVGDPGIAISCETVLRHTRLEPVCEALVDNRPYTSDFISGTGMSMPGLRIGIYKASSRKEAHDAVP